MLFIKLSQPDDGDFTNRAMVHRSAVLQNIYQSGTIDVLSPPAN
jgi:hypothetical protein